MWRNYFLASLNFPIAAIPFSCHLVAAEPFCSSEGVTGSWEHQRAQQQSLKICGKDALVTIFLFLVMEFDTITFLRVKQTVFFMEKEKELV